MTPAADDTVLLRDGSSAVVRPYAAADRPLLAEMLGRLSQETVRTSSGQT